MNFQEPDPIREYLINEMLKNIIYIGLVREKDNIEKKLTGNITSKKRASLTRELKLLTEEINILKSNKNAKYNQVIYKRFYSNLSRIRKIIHDNKKNFEELINSYIALIDSNDVNRDPALLTKQLEYIRNKLRSYISVIPTTDNIDSEKQNIESYKQTLLELEKKLDLLSSDVSTVSSEQLDIYDSELNRINENIKSNSDEELKSLIGKLKIKISQLKNPINYESNISDSDSESSNSDSSNSDSSNISLSELKDYQKQMSDNNARLEKQLTEKLQEDKYRQKEHNNELNELKKHYEEDKDLNNKAHDIEIKNLKENKEELEKEMQKLLDNNDKSKLDDEKEEELNALNAQLEQVKLQLEQAIRRGNDDDDVKRRHMDKKLEFMDDKNAPNFGGRLTRQEKKMYKTVLKMFGGNDKENEKLFSFDKSFDKEKEEDDKEEKEKEEKEKDKEEKEKEEKEKEKEEKEKKEKADKEKKELNDAKLKDKNKNEYPTDLKQINELNNFRAILITELHNIMSKATKYSKNIYKWYIDDKEKSLVYKLKELKKLTQKLDNDKIKKPKRIPELQTILDDRIKNIEEIQKIISDNIINNNDSIFNSNDGLLISINGIEDSFEEYKKIIRDDSRKALEIFFKKNNAERVNTTQYIDKLLELLNKKFKNLLSSIYDGVGDIKNDLNEYKELVENIKNDVEKEYSKLSGSDNSDNNMGNMGMMNNFYRQFGGEEEEEEDEDERIKMRRQYEENQKREKELKEEKEKRKNELLEKYYNKFNDININKYQDSLKILDVLNNNDVYDEYKYQIYGKLYSKLVDTEKIISSEKKESNQELSAITENGNIVTNENNKIENIFSVLWNRYDKGNKNKNKIKDEVEEDFYNAVKSNDLNPDKILELSLNDKVIFIVLIFVIRQISLFITETLINNNNIKSLFSIICCYLGIYIGLLLVMIIWVNMDNYKMRILLNFLNFHINSYGVYNHLFMLILFSGIIYYYIYNTDKKVQERKYDELSELEKIEIKYKLDIITLIIFIFTSLVDYLM